MKYSKFNDVLDKTISFKLSKMSYLMQVPNLRIR